MAAACLISLPGEAWPLVLRKQIDAATDKAERMEEARRETRIELVKARALMQMLVTRGTNYFKAKLMPINWREITEEKFVEVTSETERLITSLMAAADRLECALCRAEKLKMLAIEETDVFEDAREAIDSWVDQMKKLREWQSNVFGQV